MSKNNPFEMEVWLKDDKVIMHGDDRVGINAIYGSDNDLVTNWGKGPDRIFRDGSCQVSSAVWCYYALTGHEEKDPRVQNEAALQKMVKRQAAEINNIYWQSWPSRAMRDILGWLGLEGEDLDGTLDGPTKWNMGNEGFHDGDMLNIIWQHSQSVNGKPVYLMWGSGHMVALSIKTPTDLYWYDNQASLVKCESLEALKNWVRWSGTNNGEFQGKKPWACIQCKTTGVNEIDFDVAKAFVNNSV